MLRRHPYWWNLLALLLAGTVACVGQAAVAIGQSATAPAPGTWTCSVGDTASGCVGTSIAPMPTSRAHLATVTAPGGTVSPDSLVYAIGGFTLANVGAALNTFEAYDPTTNAWLAASTSPALPPLPTARASLAAALGPDGQTIYAVGGANKQSINDTLITSAVPVVEAFTPGTGAWTCSTGDTGSGCASTSIAPMPTGRAGLAAVTGSDGLIYTFGGYNSSITGTATIITTYYDYVEAYNPQTNTWTCSVDDNSPGCSSSQLPAMPTARGGLRAVLGPDGQTIYTLGGFSGPTGASGGQPFTYYSVVEARQNSTWTCSVGDASAGCSASPETLPSLLLATQGFGAATAANGAIYAFGGALIGGATPTTNVNQEFVPTFVASIRAPSMPTARRYLDGALGPDGLIYAIGGATSATPGVPATDVSLVEAFQPPPQTNPSLVLLPIVQNSATAPALSLRIGSR
jgi:hypothetical protein